MTGHCRLLLCTILLVSICLLPVSPAGAQPLYDMLNQVVQDHDLIQAAQARKDAAEQNLRLMQSDWYPHLSASANIGQEYIDPSGDRESTSKLRNYQSLRATQLVYNFGRTGSGIARAQRNVDRAAGELVAVRQEVILQGVSAWLGVLRHAQRLELARQSEKRIVDLTGIEETLVTRGAGLASDVLQAKSQLAGASALRVRTEGQLATARNRFQTVFGVELTEAQVQQMALPPRPVHHLPPSLEAALDVAEHNSLEVFIAGMELEMARHDISYRRARYYPTLQLVGEAKRRENDVGIDGVRNEALGMLELNWDIFSGGRERAAVRQARFNLAELEKRNADLNLMVQERVLSAWQNLGTARDTARLLRDQADVLEQFLELARRERQLGTRSLLDVLNGEVMYINALSNAISADLDQDTAMYGMLFAVGRLELEVFAPQASTLPPAQASAAHFSNVKKINAMVTPTIIDTAGRSLSPTYTIQVGAFRNAANARELAETLRAEGFTPSLEHVASQAWHVVRLGEYASRSEAHRQMLLFQQKTQRDALIKSLDVTD